MVTEGWYVGVCVGELGAGVGTDDGGGVGSLETVGTGDAVGAAVSAPPPLQNRGAAKFDES